MILALFSFKTAQFQDDSKETKKNKLFFLSLFFYAPLRMYDFFFFVSS